MGELKEHLAAVEVREPGELMEPGAHLKALELCAQEVELKEHLAAVEVRELGELMEPGAHLEALEPCAQAVELKELLVLKAEPGELQSNQALDLPMLRNYASGFSSYHHFNDKNLK